ncbi:MAG TPA: hypothetical protein VF103_17205 [Polyangiaceae bacterium]
MERIFSRSRERAKTAINVEALRETPTGKMAPATKGSSAAYRAIAETITRYATGLFGISIVSSLAGTLARRERICARNATKCQVAKRIRRNSSVSETKRVLRRASQPE